MLAALFISGKEGKKGKMEAKAGTGEDHQAAAAVAAERTGATAAAAKREERKKNSASSSTSNFLTKVNMRN